MILLFPTLPFVITWYCYSLFYHSWLHDTVIPYFTILVYMILLFSKVSRRFEDTKGVITISKLKKDRQHNGQKKKDNQRSTKHTHKTKDRVTRTPLKIGGELRCSGRVSMSKWDVLFFNSSKTNCLFCLPLQTLLSVHDTFWNTKHQIVSKLKRLFVQLQLTTRCTRYNIWW
jgi:hypothetical protein